MLRTALGGVGLYAVEFGSRSTRVLDGEAELRSYIRLGNHLIWALALRGVMTASLREDRTLPQTYWKEFGGEGSVRGVGRNTIIDANGGRAGVNNRNELRFKWKRLGVVTFWDCAGVWRHATDYKLSEMTNGYGVGLRYDMGIPLRLDVAWSLRASHPSFYFSMGQAF